MMVRKFISVAPIQKFRVVAADGDNGDYTINLPQDTEIAFRYRQSDSTWRRIY